jgi:hypothetical protein
VTSDSRRHGPRELSLDQVLLIQRLLGSEGEPLPMAELVAISTDSGASARSALSTLGWLQRRAGVVEVSGPAAWADHGEEVFAIDTDRATVRLTNAEGLATILRTWPKPERPNRRQRGRDAAPPVPAPEPACPEPAQGKALELVWHDGKPAATVSGRRHTA